MANPCVVIDKRTGKQYTIPEFAAELNKGMLKDLIDNKIIDNTKFERGSRLELFNASAPTSEVMQETIADIAPKTLKSITDFLQKQGIKAEIILAESQEAFEKYVREHGGTREDYANKGYYVTKKMGETKEGTIVVNLTKATSETLFHEVGHPFTDVIEATNPERIDTLVEGIGKIEGGQEFIKAAEILYATEEKALPFLREALKKAEEAGDTEKATAIKEKIASIEKDVAQQKKEIIVDFIARVADGTFEVNRNNFEKVRDYLIEFLNSFGIDIGKDYLDKKAVIELSQKLSEKFYSGEAITAEDLGLVELKTEQGEPLGEFAFQSSKSTVSKKVSKNPMYFENLKKFANESSFKNKLEFKKALEKSLKDKLPELKKIYGEDFDPTVYNETTKKYLSDILTQEAVNAIAEHPEAIGWYDAKTQSALTVIGLIHPEILTDAGARGAFITPLAIMSNGNKVDFNFDLAERQYTYFKKNGRFNPEGEYGAQQVGIRKSLKLINSLLDNGLTMEDINTFFTSKYKAGDLSVRVKNTKGELKLKSLATGELKGEQVYGAVVLGSKIGNGFYMNLWGEFGQLTMDRWFMRTWGRLTGTLIEDNPTKIENNKKTLTDALNTVKKDKKATAILNEALGDVSKMSLIELANFIEKKSADKKVRAILEGNSKTQELKNAGNNLAKNIRGEKEAPSNGTERVFIRDVFNDVSKRLKKEYNIDITMADLQAVLWYPEKILYESFKEGESFEEASEGYTEDSAPDYLNAAKKIAKKNGITDEQINQTLSDRTDSTGSIQRGRDTGGGEAVSTDNKTILEKFKESLGHKELEPKTKVKNQTTLQFSKSEVGKTVEETAEKLKTIFKSDSNKANDLVDLVNNIEVKHDLVKGEGQSYYFTNRFGKEIKIENQYQSGGKNEWRVLTKDGDSWVWTDASAKTRAEAVKIADEVAPFEAAQKISDLYHQAKADGTNPELVKAVESMFGTEGETTIQASRSEVYHGGDIVDLNSLKKDEPFFVTEDQAEAIAYASGNDGHVSIAKIDLSKIADEEVARNILEKMGFSKDEYMLHELIDPRFKESYIGKKNVEKLYAEIKSQGYDGIKFTDSSITNKRTADNIVLISPKETLADSGLGSSRIVGEMKAEELFTQGYKPVIDGKILENATEADFDKHFTTNETITMVKESPTTSKLQASRSEVNRLPSDTSIKNASISQDLIARGQPDLVKKAKQTHQQSWDMAMDRIDKGFNVKELIQEIITNPRPISVVEGAMLAYDRLNIKYDYNKKVDQINEAIINNDTELVSKLNKELEAINQQLNENDQASNYAGTEWGRSGAFRREVYSLDMTAETIEKQWRAAKNEDLTTEERAKAEAAAKKFNEAQAALDKHLEEKRQKELEAEIKKQEAAEKKALKEIQQDLTKKPLPKESINKYRNSLFSKLNDLYNEPKDNIQRSKSEVGKTKEEQVKEIIKELAKTYFAEGMRDMQDIVDAVHNDLKQFDSTIENRQVRDAISGYDSTPKPKFNEVKSEMNDIIKQMKMVSEIEDFYKKNPEAKRPTVAPKSESVVKLENQLAELKQVQKLFDELDELEKNGLSAKTPKEKKQVSQDIQDLQQMIADKKKELELKNKIEQVEQGNLPEQTTKEERALSPELQKLQDDLNNKTKLLKLSNELEKLKKEGLSAPTTPEQKKQLSQEVADLEKQISDIKKELKYKAQIEDLNQGKLPTKTEKEIEELSPELKALKDEYEKKKKMLELTNELQSLEQNGLPAPKTPEAKAAVDQEIQDINKKIADKKKELRLKGLISDVDQGKLPEKGKPREQLSAELQALQDEYNKKKRLLEKQKEWDEFRRYGSKTPTTRKEVDADIQAIQDKINEGKRIEALLKRLFELDNLENHLKALEDQVQELRDKANETGDETYNDLANDIEQQIKDKLDENQKRGKERKPKSAKQKEYENKIREKEKQLGLDEESKLKAANAQLQRRLDQLREMLRTGNVEKPKVEDVIDPRDKKLLAEVEKAKLEVEMERERLRRERMTGPEKVRDWFDKLMRAMVLSGGTIIGKLPAAGIARTFLSKPIESLLAPGFSPLSKRAPSEGKINRKAQLKAMSEWLEGSNWLIDFAESIKQSKVVLGEEFMNVLKGQGELDMLYGSKKYALDDSRLEWIGRFHAALKNPTKRAEWNRSYIKRLEYAIENGEDVSSQEVQFRIQSEAYADAMRSIFMQDNLISNGYTNFLHTLENNKYAPAPGKLLSSVLQILIPVVKIPTNYVAETGQYIPLLGAYRALGPFINVLRHGVESMTPEQADYLVRVGKKQGVGAMILAFGYMNADNIGGYYQKGENRETEDVKAGEMKVMGMHIPHWLLHSPLFEVMMMGATIKRVEDKELMKGENISSTAGFKEGLFASVLGLGEQIPQTSPIQGIFRASTNTDASNKYVGEIAARMLVPQIVKDVAKWTDVETPEGEGVKRSPKTFLENFKVGIPGLRGDVTMHTKDYVAINISDADYNKLVSTGAIDVLKPYTNRKFQTLDNPPKTYYMSLDELNLFNQKRNQLLAAEIKKNLSNPKVNRIIKTPEQWKAAIGYIQRYVNRIVLSEMNLDDLDKETILEAEKRRLESETE